MTANGHRRSRLRTISSRTSAPSRFTVSLNRHAASFALIAYASAYFKVKYLAAFTCAILNNQPMGFYMPAVLVKDAQRHGLRVRPIDIQMSDWQCTIEHEQRRRSLTAPGTGVRQGPAAAVGRSNCRSRAKNLGLVLVNRRSCRACPILEPQGAYSAREHRGIEQPRWSRPSPRCTLAGRACREAGRPIVKSAK